MNGYTILGQQRESVGFWQMLLPLVPSLLSAASSSGDKGQATSQAQIQQEQLRQEAQRNREAAARASTVAWVVGSVAGTGFLGLILWKVLAK